MNDKQIASILIVDDYHNNLRSLAAILSEEGYKVRKAISGEIALKTVISQPPDLILLDIRMPDMDGYEVCSILKSTPKTSKIPIIFLSALDETADKVKAFRVGGTDYITKPFQAEEVIARVENQLRIQRLSKQLIEKNAHLEKEITIREEAQEKLQLAHFELEKQAQELMVTNQKLEETLAQLQAIQEQLEKQNKVLQESTQQEQEKAEALAAALEQLKFTQSQLIQNEKMSALGRIVAGVAHEINNPLCFISGNLFYVSEYLQDLIKIIEAYQENYPDSITKIKEIESEIDLEFILEDSARLMKSMAVGTQRLQELVFSLKNFSRQNDSELKPVDIHENIDNTLMILQHRLKAVGDRPEIQVIKDYDLLPKVTCYGSQLSQVFMNLLSNAIDALETQPSPRRITIHTASISNYKSEDRGSNSSKKNSHHNHEDVQDRKKESIIIMITDNGSGINKEIQRNIFDPFFTTKPVGSGTGLGLSISHQIVVEKHGGKLDCISAPGFGTTFVVEIPLCCAICAEINEMKGDGRREMAEGVLK